MQLLSLSQQWGLPFQNTILLDLRALSNGVYYIKIFDGEHLFTKKLILSK
jgi:hypothetical protein